MHCVEICLIWFHNHCTQRSLAEAKEIAFKSDKMQAFHIDIEKICQILVQALTEMSTRNLPGVEGEWLIRLSSLPSVS
jgi:hypothetical protein